MMNNKMMELKEQNNWSIFHTGFFSQDLVKTNFLYKKLGSIASIYKPCSLGDLGETALMDRTDTKYVLPLELGLQALKELNPHYQMLEIEGKRLQPYNTLYFDTPELFFYRQHLRNQAVRFKLRIRSYLVNGLTFLEIKQRTNKGRTVKERIQIDSGSLMLDPEAMGWAVDRLPAQAWPLVPMLSNQFCRTLLVNPVKAERITLDFNLEFKGKGEEVGVGPLVVAEVKRRSIREDSEFIHWLHTAHQRPSSLSKYCLGLVLLNPEIKSNKFKPSLLRLQKMQKMRFA